MATSFESLGLHAELLRALTESGYTEPTPIQEQTIPLLLAGQDVLGQAQTGTGKTAAFALPLLQGLQPGKGPIQALVLAPTRELATQVSDTIYRYGQHLGVRVVPIYGGQSYVRQQRRLEKGADVLVATPGRLLDLIKQGWVDLSGVGYLVLDESDEMLKMGFIEDVETILKRIPAQHQTALFSATLPDRVRELASQYMHDPVTVSIRKATLTASEVAQRYVIVHGSSKLPALSRLLEVEPIKSALVFTRTRAASAEVAEGLVQRGYMADSISGDLSQEAREAVLRRFRNGDLPVLVATDVVARGVDIPDVSHVFNYDMPQDSEDYVHRIGRTGRAGKSGIAITLITPGERYRLKMLERFTRQTMDMMQLPRLEDIRARRDTIFAQKLEDLLEGDDDKSMGQQIIDRFVNAGYDPLEMAVAAIQLARQTEVDRPVDHVKAIRDMDEAPSGDRRGARQGGPRGARNGGPRNGRDGGREGGRSRPPRGESEPGMVRLLIDAGKEDGVRPADVVGTLAASSGIPGRAIGAIDIQPSMTYVDVKDEHVDRLMKRIGTGTRMRGKFVQLSRA